MVYGIQIYIYILYTVCINSHDIIWLILYMHIYIYIFVHVPILMHHTYMGPMGHGFLTYPGFTSQPGTFEDYDFSLSQVRY